jgi:hypothetical protein
MVFMGIRLSGLRRNANAIEERFYKKTKGEREYTEDEPFKA